MEKKKIKFIDFIKRDYEEEFETFGYASNALLWYRPDIILLYAPMKKIIDEEGDFVSSYNFFVDSLKHNNYEIESTVISIKSKDKIQPYYFFFATNAMLPLYNPFIDERFFDCIKKYQSEINFELDEVLKIIQEKITSEIKDFDPLAYRTCCLDEEIKFLERLEEYD